MSRIKKANLSYEELEVMRKEGKVEVHKTWKKGNDTSKIYLAEFLRVGNFEYKWREGQQIYIVRMNNKVAYDLRPTSEGITIRTRTEVEGFEPVRVINNCLPYVYEIKREELGKVFGIEFKGLY